MARAAKSLQHDRTITTAKKRDSTGDIKKRLSQLEKNLPPLLKGNRKALNVALSAALTTLEQEKTDYKKLILFGSWLTATARPDSDVDLCIVMKRKTCQSVDFDSTKVALKIKRLPFDFDVIVIDEHQLKTDFVSPILHEIRTKGRAI